MSFSAIFLRNTLCAILDQLDETPGLERDLPGLLDLRETLMEQIQKLQAEAPRRMPTLNHRAA